MANIRYALRLCAPHLNEKAGVVRRGNSAEGGSGKTASRPL